MQSEFPVFGGPPLLTTLTRHLHNVAAGNTLARNMAGMNRSRREFVLTKRAAVRQWSHGRLAARLPQ